MTRLDRLREPMAQPSTSPQALQSSEDPRLDVLLIEDSEPDVDLTLRSIASGGLQCRSRIVASETQFREALQERLPDFILSDFTLPGFSGMSALAIAQNIAPDVPFIFLSGTLGEEQAIQALRCGAVDYVLKSNPMRLVPAVRTCIG